MIVCVTADFHLRLDLPDDFRSFHVQIDTAKSELPKAKEALDGVAMLEDDHTAWVEETALREWPELKGKEWWQSGISQMLASARTHG